MQTCLWAALHEIWAADEGNHTLQPLNDWATETHQSEERKQKTNRRPELQRTNTWNHTDVKLQQVWIWFFSHHICIYIYSLVFCFIVFIAFMLLCFIYFLHFPLSGPVLINISLPIIPCMIMYVTNNKEPCLLKHSLNSSNVRQTSKTWLIRRYRRPNLQNELEIKYIYRKINKGINDLIKQIQLKNLYL